MSVGTLRVTPLSTNQSYAYSHDIYQYFRLDIHKQLDLRIILEIELLATSSNLMVLVNILIFIFSLKPNSYYSFSNIFSIFKIPIIQFQTEFQLFSFKLNFNYSFFFDIHKLHDILLILELRILCKCQYVRILVNILIITYYHYLTI